MLVGSLMFLCLWICDRSLWTWKTINKCISKHIRGIQAKFWKICKIYLKEITRAFFFQNQTTSLLGECRYVRCIMSVSRALHVSIMQALPPSWLSAAGFRLSVEVRKNLQLVVIILLSSPRILYTAGKCGRFRLNDASLLSWHFSSVANNNCILITCSWHSSTFRSRFGPLIANFIPILLPRFYVPRRIIYRISDLKRCAV